MQLVGYKNALTASYLYQMRESAEMIYKIAMDAEHAFWDTLIGQWNIKLISSTNADPLEIAQNILDSLPYHLNRFMENFAQIANVEFVPADFYDDSFPHRYPFYVRREFAVQLSDEENLDNAVQYLINVSGEKEYDYPAKGHLPYTPFGEAVIDFLFVVVDSVTKWLQSHDARASFPMIHGLSIEKLYNTLYSIMNNYVSVEFAGIITPTYISQPVSGASAFIPVAHAFSAKFHNFAKGLDYMCRLSIPHADSKLSNFSGGLLYTEKFDSKDPIAEFFDDALFQTSLVGNDYLNLTLRLDGASVDYDDFFSDNLVGKEIQSIFTRVPGTGYIFRKARSEISE